jgi:uncharacterized protein (TIGR03437 family)
MLNRNSSIAILLFLSALATAFGQNNQGVSFLLQQPGALSNAGSFTVYNEFANPLNPLASPTGPAGFSLAIAKPSGAGFYMIGVGVIESIDGAFATAPRVISGLAGPPTAAAITPDGKFLLVGATDAGNNGLLYTVDTVTDQVVGNAIPLLGPPQPQVGSGVTTPFCPSCFIAVSEDSRTAYVLTNTGIGSRLASINLVTRAQISSLVLSGGATSVALSPQGLLYITATNIIYEINPTTLAITPSGQIQLFFTPFRLHFTPDGANAYAVNLAPSSGGSLIKLTIASHQTVTWPSFQQGSTPPTFDDLIIAGNNRIFATASGIQRLADVTPNPFAATDSGLSVGPNNTQLNIIAAAASNELPSAKFLFMLVGNGNQTNLYRMDLGTNVVSVQNPNVPNYAAMQVVTTPPQTGVASFTTFNANQVLNTGGAAATLIARAYDGNGLPVYNAQAAFTVDPASGVIINNAITVTSADGYVQANVTVPNVGGTYNVTLTIGSATTTFTLTVPGGPVGPGGGGGSSQVTIANGDGQIVIQNQTSALPLTILVTDTAGVPLPNVPVSFTVTAGAGFISTSQTQTDANGQASTYFTGLQLTVNSTVLPVVINASTQFGSVDFHETIILISFVDGTGIPQFNIHAPSLESNYTITAPQGTPLPGAIEVQMYATGFPQTGQPIPNVGIYLYTPGDPTTPPPATCKGSTLSDSNGVAKCTLVAACKLGNVPLGIAFGNPNLGFTVALNIVAGGPTVFNIVGGNNQSGTAGSTLSGLTATLTDGCGAAVKANTPVVWAVKSGSATLVNTVSVTDFQGRVSTGVKLGQIPGPVTITVTSGTIVQTFTLTNSIIVSGITTVSGNAQSGQTGQAFLQPVAFQVKDNNGNGIPGIVVTFNVTGPGTVNPGSATTDTTGRAQTTVTATATPGTIVITATAVGFSTTATLTSKLPGPNVNNLSFTSAASAGLIGLVPCGLGTVTGNGIAPGISGVYSGVSAFGPLPYFLQGFSMTVQAIGGVPLQAPIESVSNQGGSQQANYQTPCELPPGLATVVVTSNGSSTTVTNVPVLAAQPGVFTFQFNPAGKVYGAVIRGADGSYLGPTNFARRCAAVGPCTETYYVVLTGLGQTTPLASTDSAGIPNQNVNLSVVVGINNAGVPVVSAQYAPGQIGVYIVGFQIPANVTPGPDQRLDVEVIVNGQPVFNNQSIFIPGVQ